MVVHMVPQMASYLLLLKISTSKKRKKMLQMTKSFVLFPLQLLVLFPVVEILLSQLL
jgi:hypothetical protein